MAQSDGHNPPGLIGEFVPSITAMVDEIVVGFEDAIGEPVVAHELPDVLHRVELLEKFHVVLLLFPVGENPEFLSKNGTAHLFRAVHA